MVNPDADGLEGKWDKDSTVSQDDQLKIPTDSRLYAVMVRTGSLPRLNGVVFVKIYGEMRCFFAIFFDFCFSCSCRRNGNPTVPVGKSLRRFEAFDRSWNTRSGGASLEHALVW